MEKQQQFIRMGSLGINISDILSYDLNYIVQELQMWTEENPQTNNHIPVPYVRVVTRELTYTDVGVDGYINTSKEYLFRHGTPEANALIQWLNNNSLDLIQPQHFYVTMNFYAAHISILARAAEEYGARLIAVNSIPLESFSEGERGARMALDFYLFTIPAHALEEARTTAERIEQRAAEIEEN